MQKVFKLIIDELKKAARSELKIYGGARNNGKSILLGYQKGLEDAVYIVNQTIKEYNNGWIPCSERLPEHAGKYLVTTDGTFGIDVIDIARFENNEWHKSSKIIAWMPLPEPYKEGK